MRSLLPLFAALASIVACSSRADDAPAGAETAAPPPALGGASGSRLRAKIVEGGGVREVTGFADTARGEDCTFTETTSGLRCLPRVSYGVTGAFADAACTVPLAVLPSCTADVKYVARPGARSTQPGCAVTSVVDEVRPVTKPAKTAYVNNGAGCVAQGDAPANAFELGAAVPLTSFVGASEKTTSGALSERIAEGEDGSRLRVGYQIGALSVDCTMHLGGDGVVRCLPQTTYGSLYYADAECKTPAWSTTGASRCNEPRVVSTVDENATDQCGGALRFFRVADEAIGDDPGGLLYSGSGRSCSGRPAYNGQGQSLRAVTEVTASIPTIARVGEGEGRLRPAFVRSGDGGGALVRGFYDTEKKVDCRFAKAADGKMRCLPAVPKGVFFFTDGACSSPARVATPAEVGPCGADGTRFLRHEEAQCAEAQGVPQAAEPKAARVFAVSGDPREVAGASYSSAPGKCSRVQAVRGARDVTEVPPSEFVEGVVRTE